ncbi:MAG: iron chelate uptake ABC transporter family permease subunit [Bacillota bacterium]|jgi:ABC-type enterochelin transport system, permease component|nr:iron ABC transporter permease [Bacillota bacterium]
MKPKSKLVLLAVLAIVMVIVFLFGQMGSNWSYILSRRLVKVAAMVLTAVAIGVSTVVFQTITNNRILTPSIIGLDSLYLLLQTIIIFIYGSTSLTFAHKQLNFLLSLTLMMLFSLLLSSYLFRRERQDLYRLLLIGIVLGTFFGSLSTFMQVLLDPNEFLNLQGRMFASLNQVNGDVLVLSLIVMGGLIGYGLRLVKYLDVLALGREQAINLGLDYYGVVKRWLMIISLLVSVATALVGPITFLGLLVANVTYQVLKTYRHVALLWGVIWISIIALVGGQLVVERVFAFATPLSVIINFVGGAYFLYLLIKERTVW